MKRQRSGFTLTELMLAMAFLSFLLLFIVSATVQYMATYNKGLTYKAINQAGRTIFEEVTRNVRISGANINQMEAGRLCAGGQTYVWNRADETDNKYEDDQPIEGIIRVPDSTGELCIDSGGLPPIPKEEQTIVASDRVAVQQFSGQSADEGALYHLTMTLSTSGQNAPTNTNGKIECAPDKSGEFCAFAEFETNIAVRR